MLSWDCLSGQKGQSNTAKDMPSEDIIYLSRVSMEMAFSLENNPFNEINYC